MAEPTNETPGPGSENTPDRLMRVGEFVYNEEVYEVLTGVLHKLLDGAGDLSCLCKDQYIADGGFRATVEYVDNRVRESREMLRRIIPLGAYRFTPGGAAE